MNTPHKHKFKSSKYPTDDLRDNYCRNPGKSQKGVWCFTTDPKKKWEFCDEVKPKNPEGLWGVKGDKYRGKQSKTRSGKKCQLWVEQTPHKHTTLPETHPKAGLVSNHCRNPTGEETIWCYTNDPLKRWEFCDPVNTRPALPSQETLTGVDQDKKYRGSQVKTVGGIFCQQWELNAPHRHKHHSNDYPEDDLRENFCRNPG